MLATLHSQKCYINSGHADSSFLEKMNTFRHLISFLHNKMLQVAEIFLIKDKNVLVWQVNTIAADDLAVQGAMVSSAMLLTSTHWGREQIDTISQTTFSKMKMNEFRLGFHWSLFLGFELTIFQHWFR